MISVVLMSRRREQLLRGLLESVRDTVRGKVEVVIGADLDDEGYLEFAESITADFPFSHFVFRERTDRLHERITELSRIAKGDYLIVLNDDCTFLNEGWDVLAEQKLKGRDVVYGRTHDNSIDKVGPYASFPLVSRQAFNRLGFLLEESCGNHGADVLTWRIYQQAGLVVDLPEVQINHVLHSSQHALGERLKDQTAVEMINRTFSQPFNVNELFTRDISHYVRKLIH